MGTYFAHFLNIGLTVTEESRLLKNHPLKFPTSTRVSMAAHLFPKTSNGWLRPSEVGMADRSICMTSLGISPCTRSDFRVSPAVTKAICVWRGATPAWNPASPSARSCREVIVILFLRGHSLLPWKWLHCHKSGISTLRQDQGGKDDEVVWREWYKYFW